VKRDLCKLGSAVEDRKCSLGRSGIGRDSEALGRNFRRKEVGLVVVVAESVDNLTVASSVVESSAEEDTGRVA
jgi:hypothetical protein